MFSAIKIVDGKERCREQGCHRIAREKGRSLDKKTGVVHLHRGAFCTHHFTDQKELAALSPQHRYQDELRRKKGWIDLQCPHCHISFAVLPNFIPKTLKEKQAAAKWEAREL